MFAALRKWTYREPVLMWTAYWSIAGLSAPLFIHAFTSASPSEPTIKHPPTIKEVLQAMAPSQQQQKQQQPAAAASE